MKKIKEHPSRHTHTKYKRETHPAIDFGDTFCSGYCFFLYLKNALRRYFCLTLFVGII